MKRMSSMETGTVKSPLPPHKIVVGALLTTAVLSAGMGVHQLTQTPEEVLAIAPIDPALCTVPGAGGWANRSLFFRIAAAEERLSEPPRPRSEVKPFDYAVEGTSPAAQAEPWLWDNLGTLSYRITTANADAQSYFDQGLRLSYAFNHNEALRAFRMAQKLDPQCAICYWGEAYVLGPNINAPMDQAAVKPAYAAIQRAQQLMVNASPRERALIEAMAARYSPDQGRPHSLLSGAYATGDGQREARSFPTTPTSSRCSPNRSWI